jgi:hypothetical protein
MGSSATHRWGSWSHDGGEMRLPAQGRGGSQWRGFLFHARPPARGALPRVEEEEAETPPGGRMRWRPRQLPPVEVEARRDL